MSEEKVENGSSIRSITESISYFLTGIFAVGIAIVQKTDASITLKITNWLAVIIGSLLILTGFVYLITTLPGERFRALGKNFHDAEKWSFAFLFAFISAEIVQRIVEYRNIAILFWISMAFAVLLFLTIILSSFKAVFRNVGQLLTICGSLSMMAIVQLFTPNSNTRWDVFSILIILFGFIIWTLITFFTNERRNMKTVKAK